MRAMSCSLPNSTKFERTAPVRIGHLSQVHTFVTDDCNVESLRRACVESSINLIETAGKAWS